MGSRAAGPAPRAGLNANPFRQLHFGQHAAWGVDPWRRRRSIELTPASANDRLGTSNSATMSGARGEAAATITN
jgi:hypothetical protein